MLKIILHSHDKCTEARYSSLFQLSKQAARWKPTEFQLPNHQNFTLFMCFNKQRYHISLVTNFIAFSLISTQSLIFQLCSLLLMLISPHVQFFCPFEQVVSGLVVMICSAQVPFPAVTSQSCRPHCCWLLCRQPIHFGIVLPFPQNKGLSKPTNLQCTCFIIASQLQLLINNKNNCKIWFKSWCLQTSPAQCCFYLPLAEGCNLWLGFCLSAVYCLDLSPGLCGQKKKILFRMVALSWMPRVKFLKESFSWAC